MVTAATSAFEMFQQMMQTQYTECNVELRCTVNGEEEAKSHASFRFIIYARNNNILLFIFLLLFLFF